LAPAGRGESTLDHTGKKMTEECKKDVGRLVTEKVVRVHRKKVISSQLAEGLQKNSRRQKIEKKS